MRIAYIVDSVTKYKNKDVYTVPFSTYDPNGNIVKIYDDKLIYRLIEDSKDGNKSYIEPTPGMYRDLLVHLKNQGYDHVVLIPHSKEKSNSFGFAKYATRVSNMDSNVIDVTDYQVEPVEILKHLLTDISYKKEVNAISFNLSELLNLLTKTINNLRLST